METEYVGVTSTGKYLDKRETMDAGTRVNLLDCHGQSLYRLASGDAGTIQKSHDAKYATVSLNAGVFLLEAGAVGHLIAQKPTSAPQDVDTLVPAFLSNRIPLTNPDRTTVHRVVDNAVRELCRMSGWFTHRPGEQPVVNIVMPTIALIRYFTPDINDLPCRTPDVRYIVNDDARLTDKLYIVLTSDMSDWYCTADMHVCPDSTDVIDVRYLYTCEIPIIACLDIGSDE